VNYDIADRHDQDECGSHQWAVSKLASSYIQVNPGEFILDSNSMSKCGEMASTFHLAHHYGDIVSNKISKLRVNLTKDIKRLKLDNSTTHPNVEACSVHDYNNTDDPVVIDDVVSVDVRRIRIKKQVYEILKSLDGDLIFSALTDNVSKRTASTCFYSLLELHEEKNIEIEQEESVIKITLKKFKSEEVENEEDELEEEEANPQPPPHHNPFILYEWHQQQDLRGCYY
jgi:hypothetical protein